MPTLQQTANGHSRASVRQRVSLGDLLDANFCVNSPRCLPVCLPVLEVSHARCASVIAACPFRKQAPLLHPRVRRWALGQVSTGLCLWSEAIFLLYRLTSGELTSTGIDHFRGLTTRFKLVVVCSHPRQPRETVHNRIVQQETSPGQTPVS